MILKLISAPAVEPLTVLEAKEFLRVDGSDEDAQIGLLIVTAREFCEAPGTNRAFITQIWELSFDNFPDMPLKLPRPPLQSVESIAIKDKDGVITTLDPSDYVVDSDSEPGRIAFAAGKSLPSVELWPLSAVKIRFKAGYGDTADKVPEKIIVLPRAVNIIPHVI